MQEKIASRKFNIPLRLWIVSSYYNDLKIKFFLINSFKLADTKKLIELLNKAKRKDPLELEDKSYLAKLWSDTELDDFDWAELFVCYLPSIIDSLNDRFLSLLDRAPWYTKKIAGDNYSDFIRQSTKGSARNIQRFTLPRVRAKMAVHEIIILINPDVSLVSELLKITPHYLKCSSITDFLIKNRMAIYENNSQHKKNAESNLKQISQALFTKQNKQPRRYGYWSIDYYYFEVFSCLKIAKKMKSADRKEYLKVVSAYWGIPSEYTKLLSNEIKNPSQLTLDIMIAKEMISEATAYRNVIKPYIKHMTSKYPAIRLCDYLVEHLLDLPTKSPDLFQKFDLLKQVENFTFDLTKEELKICHHISYPAHVVGV